MKISAEFVTSATGLTGLPRTGLPEIAMVGRSNVGKSTLINALVRRPVARTSGTPGKTRLINVYRVSRGSARPFHLIDLPGYGYARGASRQGSGAAGSERPFESLVGEYFFGGSKTFRTQIAGVLLIIDARHPGLPADQRAAAWLAEHAANVTAVATKVDKLTQKARRESLHALEHMVNERVVPTSALSGEGLDELWKRMTEWLNQS